MGNHQQTNQNIVAFPAGFNSGIIAVGATDDHDNIGNFSAQGPHIDVSAPGVGVWSTNFNNGYIDLTGTSMATPHVAGLASLLRGFNTNLANDDIEQIIRLTADDRGAAGFDNVFGAGRINALRALQSLQAPNTLQQLSTTGGTVFSSSGNTTKIFLGVPGLQDGTYTVNRIEVRKTVTLPLTCSLVGVWGRGVGTTGYREELGRCFGEGICEVVPGSLVNNTAILRTWIYKVYTLVSGQYLGTFPTTENNVVFQYTVLGVPAPSPISGDNIFCNTSTNYTIPSLPAGAIITWSVTPLGIATPNTPNAPQTTLTKNSNGVITLTATLSNVCTGTAVTKSNISVGTPSIPSIFAQRVGGSCYYDAAVTFSGLGTIVEFSFNNVNWQPGVKTGSTYTMGELFQGPGYQQVYARTSNTCGKGAVFSKNLYIPAPPPNCMYGPASQAAPGNITVLEEEASDRNLINIYPNPATNKVVVETPTLSNNEWISVYDMTGKLMHKEKVSKTKTVMNISGYGAGVYLIRVEADGHLIKSEKVVKEK